MINKQFLLYVCRFLVIYAVLYYGTYAVIGVAVPGGKYYSELVDKYADYPALLRKAILHTSDAVLDMMGYNSEVDGAYKVRLQNGRGVKIVYSCLGIGLFSFWIAFILANVSPYKRKIVFILTGIAGIFLVNVTRMVLLVLSSNQLLRPVFDTDHHTLVNIASYIFIIMMMMIYDRSEKKRKKAEDAAAL